ncbi:hypothetical protein SCLCIDRAFT_1221717 [Scleroderma citrinum Foug A]|uniref:Uncharacterized protein n=1 Tax=Scleroderma citrinum Foug A TaxID=1036808 RepID=A0A0C3DF53_9AGAM|nr:hypothetical protein SCLCIDRAFT_1221717 [Scleroderma citrinum Foug A]
MLTASPQILDSSEYSEDELLRCCEDSWTPGQGFRTFSIRRSGTQLLLLQLSP